MADSGRRAGAASLRLVGLDRAWLADARGGRWHALRPARDLSAVRLRLPVGHACHVRATAPATVLTLFACHLARRRLFPGVRSLLAGSGQARASDDMAALAWQLGAGAGAPAATTHDGDDGGFGFTTAASPLAAMLTEARTSARMADATPTRGSDAPACAAARQQGARRGRPPLCAAAGG